MTIKCNTENMRRWIEALESGEYEQTNGVLFDGTGYCCLGVLAKIQGYEFVPVGTKEHVGWGVPCPDVPRLPHTGLPPVAAVDWLGIDRSEVGGVLDNVLIRVETDYDGGSDRIHATEANDNGESFASIAAQLREMYGIEREA